MTSLINRLKTFRCNAFHIGGYIDRDEQGRINWRCACGRWSDSPVPVEDEHKVIVAQLKKYQRK